MLLCSPGAFQNFPQILFLAIGRYSFRLGQACFCAALGPSEFSLLVPSASMHVVCLVFQSSSGDDAVAVVVVGVAVVVVVD